MHLAVVALLMHERHSIPNDAKCKIAKTGRGWYAWQPAEASTEALRRRYAHGRTLARFTWLVLDLGSMCCWPWP